MVGLDELRSQLIRRKGSAARIISAALPFLLASCDRPAAARDGGTDASDRSARPGYVVDSILQPEEALRRFRADVPEPERLDGAAQRDSLVGRFFAALNRADRGALARLAITRAEFAWLVYPETRTSRPPYRQPPDIAWLLLRNSSAAAVSKLVQRAGELEPLSYRCAKPPEQEGRLRLWSGCTVRVRHGGSVRDMRLFGTIIERDGRYKFAGFDNDL